MVVGIIRYESGEILFVSFGGFSGVRCTTTFVPRPLSSIEDMQGPFQSMILTDKWISQDSTHSLASQFSILKFPIFLKKERPVPSEN